MFSVERGEVKALTKRKVMDQGQLKAENEFWRCTTLENLIHSYIDLNIE